MLFKIDRVEAMRRWRSMNSNERLPPPGEAGLILSVVGLVLRLADDGRCTRESKPLSARGRREQRRNYYCAQRPQHVLASPEVRQPFFPIKSNSSTWWSRGQRGAWGAARPPQISRRDPPPLQHKRGLAIFKLVLENNRRTCRVGGTALDTASAVLRSPSGVLTLTLVLGKWGAPRPQRAPATTVNPAATDAAPNSRRDTAVS
jgi:hypothetical protein